MRKANFNIDNKYAKSVQLNYKVKEGDENMQMKLIEARKKKNLTQKDMADMLGMSVVAYRERELDKVDFKLPEVFLISSYFHRDVGDLFSNSGMRKANKK